MTNPPPPMGQAPAGPGSPDPFEPPPPAGSPAAAAPPTPAREPSKLRLYLVLGGIAVFMAVVLWAVRNNASVDDLTAGTCFDVPSRSADISTVVRHACTEPHDAEVFHVADYTGTSYPISLSLNSFVDDTCVPVVATYVGQDLDSAADLTIGYFYPSREGWDRGDRTVTCYLVRVDEAKLSQALKGSR